MAGDFCGRSVSSKDSDMSITKISFYYIHEQKEGVHTFNLDGEQSRFFPVCVENRTVGTATGFSLVRLPLVLCAVLHVGLSREDRRRCP